MSINFNRNRTQEAYENILGISSPEELLARKDDFKKYVLTENDVLTLKPLLKQDAVDFFHNAIVSFSEGIDSIYERRFSWATVKLYYSIFYLLRASMACGNIALLRNCSMFRLKLQKGEKPFSTNNKKYNSTHGGTISHYKDVFSGIDKLLTNKIDDVETYQWMEDLRDIVNYKEVCFRDPDCLDVWAKFKKALDDGELDKLFDVLLNDSSYVYCFQEEYAVVAVPIKRMQQTIVDMSNAGLLNLYQNSRIDYVETIMQSSNRNIHLIDSLNP